MLIEPISNQDSSFERISNDSISRPNHAEAFDALVLQLMLQSTCIDQHFENSTPVEPIADSGFYSQTVHVGDDGVAGFEPVAVFKSPSLIEEPHLNTASVQDFIKSIEPYAKQASQLIGLDPKILIAQAALETGWGKFIAKDRDGSSSCNLFNIKSTSPQHEPTVKIRTTEYIEDKHISITASFKKYDSIQHSFNDYVAFIKSNHRYKEALENAQDPKRYVDELQKAGYATDPDYANKIFSIYSSLG